MKDVVERVTRARRAGNVHRFHCYDMVHPENVAQHTFNVMNLLMVMTGGTISHRLLEAALLHDQGEYVTGDIPSPIKRMMGGGASVLNSMEEQAIQMIHVRGTPDLTEWEHTMLKAADNLDGLLTCVREVKRGNTQMAEVASVYAGYLKELGTKLGGGTAGEIVQYYIKCWENMK